MRKVPLAERRKHTDVTEFNCPLGLPSNSGLPNILIRGLQGKPSSPRAFPRAAGSVYFTSIPWLREAVVASWRPVQDAVKDAAASPSPPKQKEKPLAVLPFLLIFF